MRIGVVKVASTPYVEEALRTLGHTPVVFQINDDDLVTKIKDSTITHWIFTGTGIAVSVLNPLAPKVPLDIFKLKEKRFLLICYSMESVLHQMGYPINKRYETKKERIYLDGLRVYRNHRFYTPVSALDSTIQRVHSYRGEVMTAVYTNSVMTQWHPERTADGIQWMKGWIES